MLMKAWLVMKIPIELGVMNESFYYTDLFVKQIQDMSKAGVPQVTLHS